MPICDDPNALGFYTLRADRNKPLEKRPMFICKFLTVSKSRATQKLSDDAFETKDNAQCMALLIQAIQTCVVGWKNFVDEAGSPIEFSESALVDRLTNRELWELARGCANAITEDDLKNSASPA
jgi:hypothetical protein